jgi:hypothetical protein
LFSWPSLDNANIKVYDYEDIIGILLHRMFLFDSIEGALLFTPKS